jgi:RNA polymerase sigma factor (sigma-70 family)
LNESEKIERLKNGDQAEFEALVTEYQTRIYNTCLSLLQNEEDAEDVCQEVFISVFQSIGNFKGQSKLYTWMYRIAVTRSLEFIRSKKRKKRFAFFRQIIGDESGEIKTEAFNFYHPGVQLENKERAAVLFKAIDLLSENQKTAFILSKIEELSYAEIAEIMQVSVPSVESLLFRAKQNLQKILGNYYRENEK